MTIPEEVQAVVHEIVQQQGQPTHLAEKIVRALAEVAVDHERQNTDELMKRRLQMLFDAVIPAEADGSDP